MEENSLKQKLEELVTELNNDEVTNSVMMNLDKYFPDEAIVKRIQNVIKYAQEHPEETMFVICKFPSDALAILESGLEVQEVNVGNAAPIQGTTYKMVTKSIAVTEEDAKCYRKIAELRGGVLNSRLTTMNETENFLELLSKNGL